MSKEHRETPLSAQKRLALVRYMAILFAVAFLLVLLSYLVQSFNSQSTISQLNATSASALQNAEQLQQTNRELTEENKSLHKELEQAREEATKYQWDIVSERQAARVEGREEGKNETMAAYDLLLRAMAAPDKETAATLLAQLESAKDLLSPEALAQYEALKTAE